MTISWVQTAGPAQAAIVSPSQAVTKVSFPTSGTYTFQLSATNGQFAANSSTNVTVTAPPSTQVRAIPLSLITGVLGTLFHGVHLGAHAGHGAKKG